MAVEVTKFLPLPESPEGLRAWAEYCDAQETACPFGSYGFHAALLRRLADMTDRIDALEKKNVTTI